jgi:hypothetical protein
VRREGACSKGEGTRPPLDATLRRSQGQRICYRHLRAQRLAERVVSSPPKVLGLDTQKDDPGPLGCRSMHFDRRELLQK